MSEPRNKVELSADVAAGPDETFTYLTDHFGEIWPGKMEKLADGTNEPFGLGFRRRMHTPAGKLEEEITTHDRPGLIEYVVTNGDEASIHNHLGRIELTEAPGGGTHIDYAITYDYRPAFLGPVSVGVLKGAWGLRSKRKLHGALGSPA